MDKNAPSDFTHAFHAVISDGLKKQVPLEFMVMNLEITKIDLANRFINQQAAMKAQGLAQQIADATPRIDKPNTN
jgi:hypothetical protein